MMIPPLLGALELGFDLDEPLDAVLKITDPCTPFDASNPLRTTAVCYLFGYFSISYSTFMIIFLGYRI